MTVTAGAWTQLGATGTFKTPQIVPVEGGWLSISLSGEGHSGKTQVDARFSADLETWGDPVTVAAHATDSIAFPATVVLPSGRIVVWAYRRPATAPYTPIDSGYSYSDDGGDTWTGYTSRGETLAVDYGARLACSTLPFGVDGKTYLPHYAGPNLGDRTIRIYETTDGIEVSDNITPVPDATAATLLLSEHAAAAIGDVWVDVIRSDVTTAKGFHIAVSQDGAETWSEVVNVLLPNLLTWTHPNVLAHQGRFWLMVGDRHGDTGYMTAPFTDDKLWVYSTTPERVVADPSDWDLEGSFARPNAEDAEATFYCYPQMFVVDADTVHVSVLGAPGVDETAYWTLMSGFRRMLTATHSNGTVSLSFPASTGTLERSIDGGEWVEIAELNGDTTYEDTVTVGGSYVYRIGTLTSEAVEVPWPPLVYDLLVSGAPTHPLPDATDDGTGSDTAALTTIAPLPDATDTGHGTDTAELAAAVDALFFDLLVSGEPDGGLGALLDAGEGGDTAALGTAQARGPFTLTLTSDEGSRLTLEGDDGWVLTLTGD